MLVGPKYRATGLDVQHNAGGGGRGRAGGVGVDVPSDLFIHQP